METGIKFIKVSSITSKSSIWVCFSEWGLYQILVEDSGISIYKDFIFVSKPPSLKTAFLLVECYIKVEKSKKMNKITLNDTRVGSWYTVVDGHSYLVKRTTIRIEKFTDDSVFVLGESVYDEMGVIVPLKDADKILVEEIFF